MSEAPMATAGGKDEHRIANRIDLLKKASIDVYSTGISLKLAARKWHVGYAELRYFYENEAAEYLLEEFGLDPDSDFSDP